MFFAKELQLDAVPSADVAVVAFNQPVHGSLSDLAGVRRWPLLSMMSAKEALSAILQLHARLVVVQVSRDTTEVLALLRAARRELRRLVVVAAAIRHAEELERTLRRNGVDYYVWLGHDASLLEQLIEARAERWGTAGRAVSGTRPKKAMDQP